MAHQRWYGIFVWRSPAFGTGFITGPCCGSQFTTNMPSAAMKFSDRTAAEEFAREVGLALVSGWGYGGARVPDTASVQEI